MIEPHEASSNTVRGLVTGLTERGLLEKVQAKLSPAALEALRDPSGQRWWAGTLYGELAQAVIDVAGPQTYQDICLKSAQRTFGPIVAPMVKVTLALVGSTPGSLLAKLSLLASVAIRGPVFAWKSTGANSGTLEITYRAPTQPALTILTWKATIEYAFQLTKPGKITRASAEDGGQRFVFDVSW